MQKRVHLAMVQNIAELKFVVGTNRHRHEHPQAGGQVLEDRIQDTT